MGRIFSRFATMGRVVAGLTRCYRAQAATIFYCFPCFASLLANLIGQIRRQGRGWVFRSIYGKYEVGLSCLVAGFVAIITSKHCKSNLAVLASRRWVCRSTWCCEGWGASGSYGLQGLDGRGCRDSCFSWFAAAAEPSTLSAAPSASLQLDQKIKFNFFF